MILLLKLAREQFGITISALNLANIKNRQTKKTIIPCPPAPKP